MFQGQYQEPGGYITTLSILCWVFSYLSGSLPFAVWVMRWVKGIDVRAGGSGHMTTTNTIRQAGWVPGILVFILDTAKGFIPIYMAVHIGLPNWSTGLTAMFVVIGHCWPIFAQFRGGKGLAVTGGMLLAISLPGFLLAVSVLIFFILITHHAARGSLFTALIFPVVLWLVGLRGMITYISAPAGLVVAGRYVMEWNRKYREFWLDRKKET